MTVRYRAYDETKHTSDVAALFDVDEYYPDLVRVLGTLSAPTILLTGWLFKPGTELVDEMTLQRLFVRELKKLGARIFMLWNTNNGGPNRGLAATARKFHADVIAEANKGVPELLRIRDNRFKILLSSNVIFDVPNVEWGVAEAALWITPNPDKSLPSSVGEALQRLWLTKFPRDPAPFKNLTAFTTGSHHQKTITVIGRAADGTDRIYSYCGGCDISSAPAGRGALASYGGAWWHDATLRVTGANAIGVLANFVERWNLDHDEFVAGKNLGHGIDPVDRLDVDALMTGVERATAASGAVATARTMPLEGVDWPLGRERVIEALDAYKTWIPRATERLFILNQYFRSREIAALVAARLEHEPNLRVTIVIPMYTEEIGKREDLVDLREKYVKAEGPAVVKLLRKIRGAALTIDPGNKLTLYAQSLCLGRIIENDRVRVWMARPPTGIPYIHSKLLLVDDKALMIGSSNVNGRSMTGLADSEINLLVTDRAEVARIRDAQGWHVEPDGPADPAYAGSWYANHNLVRYTHRHWEVDTEYGAFPAGYDGLFRYFDSVKADGRVGLPKTKLDRAAFDRVLQAEGVLHPFTDDFGELLLDHAEHLI